MRHILIVLLLLAANTTAYAEIIVTGDIVVVDPPASVELDAYEHNSEIRIFAEQVGVVATDPLFIDIRGGPGVYSEYAAIRMGAIVSYGGRLDSYLLHYDPEIASAAAGTVTFDDTIIALLVTKQTLRGSDALFAIPSTAYAHSNLVLNDSASSDTRAVLTMVNRHTLELDLRTTTSWEHLRVITLSTAPIPLPIPEPTTVALLLTGLFGLALFKRRHGRTT